MKISVLLKIFILILSIVAGIVHNADVIASILGVTHPSFIRSYNGQMYRVVNCKQSITLRTKPTVYADEITQIPLGAVVGFIDNAGNGFYKVNYDGVIGYALSSYLDPQN